MKVKFKKLSELATIPTRANPTDAGIDFYAIKNQTIYESLEFNTNIAWAVEDIPDGFNTYLQMKSRSGLAFKKDLEVTNAGVIDENYRGDIGIKIYNNADQIYQIRKGDKIAQGIVMLIPKFEIEEVSELNDTDRGANGFGSSGK